MNRSHRNTDLADEAPPLAKRDWLLMALLTLLGLSLRLFIMRYETVILDDGVQYAWLGAKLIQGDLEGGLSAYWPPMFPLMIGLASLVTSNLQSAGQLVSLLSGTALIPLAYLFARPRAAARLPFCVALLVAVNPQLISSSAGITTGALYGLFMLLGVHFGWRAIFQDKMGSYALCGLSFGAMYLTRPEGIGFGILVIVFALCQLYRARVALRRGALCLVLLVGGLAVTAGPYLNYIHSETGIWTISQKFAIHFGGVRVQMLDMTPDGTMVNADIFYGGKDPADLPSARIQSGPIPTAPTGSLEEEAKRVPPPPLDLSLRHATKNFFMNLSYTHAKLLPNIFTPFIVPLAAIGLFAAPWSRRRLEREVYLGLFVVATFVGYALTWSLERYFYSIIPIVLLWAAHGIQQFETWTGRTFSVVSRTAFSRRLFHIFVLGCLMCGMIPGFTYPIRRVERRQATQLKTAGEFIRQDTALDTPDILGNTPVPAFYAGGTHHYLPNVDSDSLVSFVQRRKPDYLVFYEQKIWYHRLRGHRPFLERYQEIPGFEVARRDTEKLNGSVTIYRAVP